MSFIQVGRVDKPRFYQGLKDMAVDGLHETVVPLVKGPNVLDLGSGEGALAQRLSDAGHNVTASEMTGYKGSLSIVECDFNTHEWSNHFTEKYDSVIAIEVIEHLKCPWMFIEEAAKLMRPGGQLLISTPNIENPISKGIFLLRGQYFLFRVEDLSYGHISPLTEFQIRTICCANGFKLERVVRAGSYPIIYLHRNLKDSILWSTIALMAYPFSRNQSPCKIYDISK
jgi:2-polyprenyl-3-methyl-5-hydroxy-6-metoxy-1,4-benzoquinol methylase